MDSPAKVECIIYFLRELEMILIRAPNDLVKKLLDASNSQGRPFVDYVTEILEQAMRAHNLDSSLEEIVDFYERTMIRKETTEEQEFEEEPSVHEVFERLLASKLSRELKTKTNEESEERRMLNSFLSQLSKKRS